MGKEFAKEYQRNKQGWVLFPPDTEYRKQLFPPKVNKHPAKANVFLVQSIIDYVSEPEQTIMDIMAGSGTILIGALLGRRIVAIDISKKYVEELILPALEFMESYHTGISDFITTINQPCQNVLPLPGIDHIIFSPPYAQIMKTKGKDSFTIDTLGDEAAEYHQGALNVGAVNEFLFAHLMEAVYQKCYNSLKPSGTLTVIIKDHMKDRQRVSLSGTVTTACIPIGFELQDWFKWRAPGSSYTNVYRSRGWEVVDDEDIIILRR